MAVEPPVKRRKLSPPSGQTSNQTTSLAESSSLPNKTFNTDAFYSNASGWNLEQDYENKSRKLFKQNKESTRLPIKTAQGTIQRIKVTEDIAQDDDADSWLEASDSAAESTSEEVLQPEGPQVSNREQIIAAKEELARLALLLNQDPEDHSSAFKSLSQIGYTGNATVKKLALATQMTVFKDVIPGYRIRSLTDKDMIGKVSKEVRKKRAAEQSLVRYYQKYVHDLSSCAKRGKKGTGLDSVATSCTCSLLLAVPHFNFRGDLLKILINKLSHRKVDDQSRKCVKTLEKLFAEDEDGNASLDAVRTLVQMMKARKWNIDESVLNTFLHLRLLSEFNSKASSTTVDKPTDFNGKKIKPKREFRSKKQRKVLKELKAVEKDFQEADAIVSHEERDKKQAETLKLVFATYFKILKARTPHLTGAVLEGLAKFAHLINQDFFGDLLEVFKELAYDAASHLTSDADSEVLDHESPAKRPLDPARTALLCTTTAFALLSAQDLSRLSLDLSTFTSLLYSLLIPHLALHPDLEFSHKTLRLADPHLDDDTTNNNNKPHTPKINVSTTSTLLLRTLTSALSSRNTLPTRLAAFTHRILTMALQTPEKTTRALLALLAELARPQGKKMRPLWHSEERRGDGEYDATADIGGCRPYAGSVWEGELLRLHFANGVRHGVGELEGVVRDFV